MTDLFSLPERDLVDIRNSEAYKLVIQHAKDILTERTSINKKINSYGLKHNLERYLKTMENYTYISNEAFILGMSDINFKTKRESIKSPNYCFNIKPIWK